MRLSPAPAEKLLTHKKVQFQFEQCEKRTCKSEYDLITGYERQQFYWHHNTTCKVPCVLWLLSQGKKDVFTKYIAVSEEHNARIALAMSARYFI